VHRTIRFGLSVLWIVSLAGIVYWLHEPQAEFRDHIVVSRFVPSEGHSVDLVTPGGVACDYSMPTCSTATGVLTRSSLPANDPWRQRMFGWGVEELSFSPDSRTFAYFVRSPLRYETRVRFVDTQTRAVLGEVMTPQYKFSADGECILVDDGPACGYTRPHFQAVYRLRPFQFQFGFQATQNFDLENFSQHGRWAHSGNEFVNVQTGQRHLLSDPLSGSPIIARDELHVMFHDQQGRTHWFNLTTGEDQIAPAAFREWLVQLPTEAESENLFIGTRNRTVPNGLKRLLKKILGGSAAPLISDYEENLVEVVNPVSGDRPRWLPCRGTCVAVSRDSRRILTVDRNRNLLLWHLNRWTPGPWESGLLAVIGLAAIWRGRGRGALQ
jgi:hypothetical protein